MLVPWKKAMTNLDSILKRRDITLLKKGPHSQSSGFSSSHVWIWGLDLEKAEHGRTDAFKLWCQRRLLRVLWTARGANQSILKEINPEYSLEGLMLKPKLQYFGHLMRRANSLEKTLVLEKIEGRRRREWQRMRWLGGVIDTIDMSLSKLGEMVRTGKPGVLQSRGSQRVRHDWATEQQ